MSHMQEELRGKPMWRITCANQKLAGGLKEASWMLLSSTTTTTQASERFWLQLSVSLFHTYKQKKCHSLVSIFHGFESRIVMSLFMQQPTLRTFVSFNFHIKRFFKGSAGYKKQKSKILYVCYHHLSDISNSPPVLPVWTDCSLWKSDRHISVNSTHHVSDSLLLIWRRRQLMEAGRTEHYSQINFIWWRFQKFEAQYHNLCNSNVCGNALKIVPYHRIWDHCFVLRSTASLPASSSPLSANRLSTPPAQQQTPHRQSLSLKWGCDQQTRCLRWKVTVTVIIQNQSPLKKWMNL